MSPLFLGIDNGTQSVRALVFDAQGNLVAKSRIAIEPYFSAQPGWAEQHAAVYWNAVCAACREIVLALGADGARLRGVAVTTQRGTVIAVDATGEPLRPAITWLDQRRAGHLPAMGGGYDVVLSLLGQSALIAYFRGQAESNWIRENEPALWQRTHKFLLLSGYLNFRLCGEYVDSSASQVGYLPFDFRKHAWAGVRDWKWRATGIRREQLPELKGPAQQLGMISVTAAEQTGLPAGLPLFAAGADKACEILGSGCVVPEIGALSYGTTATINACLPRYVEVVPRIPAYPAALPGAYCSEVQIFRGFWMVEWFLKQFGASETQRAQAQGIEPHQLFDALIDTVPAGSMGLVLQPYWTPGIKRPGLEAKGAIIGFGDVHTRAHIYRAILEGLGYALREGKHDIERRGGFRMQRLRVSGGGSQSDKAMQITADIFGLPAERPHTFETSGLGAAMAVAVGSKEHASFAEAVRAMTRVADCFTPDPRSQKIYDELYRDVYLHLYGRLRPLYRRIRDIVDYPKRG